MKYMWLSFSILLLFSCVTQEEQLKDIKPISEVYIADIEQLLSDGSYMKAIQDISYLERENRSIEPGTLKELETRLFLTLLEKFTEFIADSNFNDAYRLYMSLFNIGKARLLPEWSEKKLIFSLARMYSTGTNRSVAMYYYLKALENSDLTKEECTEMLDFASQLSSKPALRLIINYMDEKNYTVGDNYRDQAQQKSTKAAMMRGTAIIWIDKGIKIEKGYGIPDRVMGSGFFVDKSGYMLTNHHVIESEVDPKYEGFSRLYVRLSKNVDEKIPAKVIGYDRVFDIALLKLSITPDYVFYSGGNVAVEPGEKVVAIGAPLGLENTLTSGIVSNLSRRFIQIGDVMQIDAPVNPGNSGGPLLNENDDLLGVVFAGLATFEGLNFAIPYNWVNKIYPRLFEEGEITHSWLGLALDENESGLEVIYTIPGEPAWRAGIKPGDIIKELNGHTYTSIRDFQEALLNYQHDSLVKLSWSGGDKTKEGIICLTKRPSIPIELALKKDTRNNVIVPLFGMEIKAVKNFLWETEYIVTRVYQGSIADNSGISENDPLSIKKWFIDTENRVAVLQVFIKKKNAGFFESIVQLATYLETDNFI
ncbi:MAG: trypsin-like peptidase domain-containing protein [Spirochaetales bacterium]|nr:trypsin-like peptidase domain-containing protein [Spirochaetales bacterium]